MGIGRALREQALEAERQQEEIDFFRELFAEEMSYQEMSQKLTTKTKDNE